MAFTMVWMICQLPAEPIQLAPLSDGLEIRQVSREQLPAIYAENVELFSENHDPLEGYDIWLRGPGEPDPDTSLWVVTWDGD